MYMEVMDGIGAGLGLVVRTGIGIISTGIITGPADSADFVFLTLNYTAVVIILQVL